MNVGALGSGCAGSTGGVAVEFGILGPLQIRGAGGPIEVRGPKRRGLVAILLVHANQRLGVDHIVDSLWDDPSPRGAVRTVQTYVSQIRRLLDDPQVAVHQRDGAYTLELPVDALDATRFEAMVHESTTTAEPAARLGLLDRALDLWRGEPLEEWADARWASAERTRLELARLTAVERRIDACFELGRHREMIGELEAVVDRAPLDERLWGRLLVAYYGAGRQGDALRAYQRARHVLSEELGVEPSTELADLERRILDQDPTLVDRGDRSPGAVASSEALPDGVLTFLMTDIEDSTRLWDDHPVAMAPALARHEQLVAAAVGAHDGRLVKARGDGDGSLSVFTRASDAACAAIDLQRRIREEDWPAGVVLRTRIGVHTGEAQRRGGDYFGGPLNRAARIRALAGGGQILCSGVTAGLVSQLLPDGAALVTVGTHALRGLRTPESVHELVHPDIRDATLPAATSDRPGARVLPPTLRRAAGTPFVGREAELARLESIWQAGSAGGVQLAFLSGEPGVGKTRLAAELGARLHDGGAVVVYGRCDEDLAVPYQPFAEAVRVEVAARGAGDVAADLGLHPALAHLLPELSQLVPSLAPPVRADPETERYQLFEAVGAFFDGLARDRALLVVLDDLHWAGKPTLLLLRHLARRPATAPVLVLGTYRDTELHRRHPLADALADLRREDLGDRIVLRGLDRDEVTRFVQLTSGQERGDDLTALSRAVHDETEGNPFFVGQVLRHLVESGAVERRDGRWVPTTGVAHIGLPEGVREVISRRLAVLGDRSDELLTLASVVGRDFDAGVLVAIGGGDPDEVLDVLDEAAAARLVEPVGDGTRFSFVHALVRSVLYESIPTTRRLRLHRDTAQALIASTADDDAPVAEIARHLCESAALGGVEEAIEYALRAAALARRQLAFEEAASLYERALGVLEPGSEVARVHRGEILVELIRVLWDAGERERARDVRREAVEHARSEGDAALLARAALSEFHLHAWMSSGDVDQERIALCEEVLSSLPGDDSALRARVTARLAGELLFDPTSGPRRDALVEDALAMARRVDDPHTLTYVLGAVQGNAYVPGGARRRLAALEETLELARALGERELEFFALRDAAGVLVQIGDVGRADEMLDAQSRIADELQRPLYHFYSQADRAARALTQGDLDVAAVLAADSLRNAHDAGNAWMGLSVFGAFQFELARARGDDEEFASLESGIDALVEHFPRLVVWRAARALFYALLDRTAEARADFEALGIDDEVEGLPRLGGSMIEMAVAISTGARLGDRVRAQHLYRLLEPYGDELVTMGGVMSVGSAELFLALAAGTADRFDLADPHYATAMEVNRRTGCRLWIVTGTYEYAALLARRGRDPERVRALLAECGSEARALGMSRAARSAEALAATVG